MSDAADQEDRNEWGLPLVEAPANRGNINQHVDNSVNRALPWVVFSWFLSGGAIIGLILMAIMLPNLIDSRVEQGVSDAKAAMAQQVADARAEISQQVADAKASANAGREHSRIALAEVERANAELVAKRLIRPSH